jgi:hypothetical protein
LIYTLCWALLLFVLILFFLHILHCSLSFSHLTRRPCLLYLNLNLCLSILTFKNIC